jgi:hypothetical protein
VTFFHGSNARNLPVYLSLSQLAKMLCLSYYCLYSIFNKIRDKDRTDSARKQGWLGGKRRGQGEGGEMAQTMYAHMNKRERKKILKEQKNNQMGYS